MIYLLIGGAVFVFLVYLYALFTQGEIRRLVRTLRWGLGLVLVAGAAILAAGGRMALASMLALAGAGILMRGRIGPIDLGGGVGGANNSSRVKSRYFVMELDHDSGTVTGTVREGRFRGQDLGELGPEDFPALLAEVAQDPDSLALLESWLDANRAGWREQFGEGGEPGPQGEPPLDEAEAYRILGLKPGAGREEIVAAHRRLMKTAHPDRGGSAEGAARLNQAKDFLLKRAGGG